jgi:hypothetical protein
MDLVTLQRVTGFFALLVRRYGGSFELPFDEWDDVAISGREFEIKISHSVENRKFVVSATEIVRVPVLGNPAPPAPAEVST